MQKYPSVCFILIVIFLSTPNVEASEETWMPGGLASSKTTAVETTPYGIFAGENDSRLWNNPHNGIFISENADSTWVKAGLAGKGITDIHFSENSIYATTYYFNAEPAGLFLSQDRGDGWIRIGPEVSTSTVTTTDNSIVLGTFSHGLWVSYDGGTDWEQKLGTGFYGPKIYKIAAKNDTAIASLESSTYISLDSGASWHEIDQLSGLKVRAVNFTESLILAGTTDSGLFKSADGGSSWEAVESWGSYSATAISQYENILFVAQTDAGEGKIDVLKSGDNGNTWISTNLGTSIFTGSINDLAWIYLPIPKLLASTGNSGLFMSEIPKQTPKAYPFMEPPWKYTTNSELVDKIYSYFDHEYPLNSYPNSGEPPDASDTTYNYLGIKDREPHFYYSSHDGYDFTLQYGTPISASAPGYATYKNISGGNAILVDHQNGYQSTYLHLQDQGLAVNNENESVWVNTGEVIGLVGLTGITTGPHLHFSVQKDLDNDGLFEDNKPDGIVDPFAWQNEKFADPWPLFSWTDTNGTHNGTESLYLWNFNIPETAKYIKSNATLAGLENLSLAFPDNNLEQNITVTIQPYPQPRFPLEENKLTYITGTSFLINAYNNLGEKPPPFLQPARIEIDLNNANLDNIIANTLSIYYWDEESSKWEKVPSVLNLLDNKIYGEVYHFSHFAVLGEKTYYNGWEDKAVVKNTQFTFQ